MLFLTSVPVLVIGAIFVAATLLCLVETEHEVIAGCVLVTVILFTSWYTGTSVLEFFADNLGLIAGVFVGYLAAGLGWAYAKWHMFLNSEDFGKVLGKAHQNYAMLKSPRADFKSFFREEYRDYTVAGRRTRITSWMIWWPLSMFWFFTHDMLTTVYRWLYNSFATLFSSALDNRLDRGVD